MRANPEKLRCNPFIIGGDRDGGGGDGGGDALSPPPPPPPCVIVLKTHANVWRARQVWLRVHATVLFFYFLVGWLVG